MRTIKKSPFTLVETLIATGLTVLVLAVTVPFIWNSLQVSLSTAVKNQLVNEQYLAVEYLRRDLLCTSRAKVLTAPIDGSPIQATSFPIIWRGKNVIYSPVNTESEVLWTDTVIYHIYTNPSTGKQEFRRTRFTNRDNSLTLDQRQAQLDAVLLDGNGENTYNGTNATTKTLLHEVNDFAIVINPHEVDCYAPEVSRAVVSLGSAIMTPGVHKLKFVSAGRNQLSSGNNIGIDFMIADSAGSTIEAEHLTPVEYSGPKPIPMDMSHSTGWSNHSVLNYKNPEPGQHFVLEAHNSCWMESAFNADMAVLDNAEVTFDSALAESVVQQVGNDTTWQASIQTGGGPVLEATAMPNATIRTIIAGGDSIIGGCIAHEGQRGSVTFSNTASTTALTIENAYIMERTSGFDGDPATVRQLLFHNSAVNSGAQVSLDGTRVSIKPGSIAESDRFDLALDPDKDYLVSFHLSDVPEEALPMSWTDSTANVHAYMIPDDSADLSGTADWSSTGAAPQGLSRIVSVQSVFASYPAASTYTSQIFNTKTADPQYLDLKWDTRLEGSSLAPTVRVRTGDLPDLSDAPSWDLASEFSTASGSSLSGVGPGQYVQYQVVFHGAAPYTETAKMKYIYLTWQGQEEGVEMSAAVVKGPDKGIFRFYVDDGNAATSDLHFEFTIGRKFRNQYYQTAFAVDGKPRNE